MSGIRGGNIFGGGKLGGIMLGGGIFRIRNKLWCKIVYELKIKCIVRMNKNEFIY